MLRLTRLTALFSAAAITFLCFDGLAVAQNRENYVKVGKDSSGNPILLDLTTIRGTSYEMFGRYGNNGLFKATYRASCAENRLFVSNAVIYSAGGRALAKDISYKEISFAPSSAADKSIGIVCGRIHAPAWGGL